MSGLRGVMKEGWHPKGKNGGKESWRGDFKGINQVASWVGKGKDSSVDAQEHVSRPLSSLQDPASFGPPPKRNAPGTGSVSSNPNPERRGLGAALSPDQIQQSHNQPEQEDKPAPPPLPYRADRTGLSTDHLPPPPVRHTDASTQPPALNSRPSLPPRLPARAPVSQSASPPPPPPPPYSETDNAVQMNQGAMSRLEQAGVSVPALGIGRRGSDQSATAQTNLNNQVHALQNRFGNMSTPSSRSPQSPQGPMGTPTNGTTLAENKKALHTAQNLHNDPSSVSAAEARNTASTVNNFRQRHNEHFEAGKQKLSAFNQKHRITERIQAYFEEQPAEQTPQSGQQPVPPPPPPHPNLSRQSSNIDMEALNKRKPPPPPPPAKKPGLQANPVGNASPSPPPLPLGTKPR